LIKGETSEEITKECKRLEVGPDPAVVFGGISDLRVMTSPTPLSTDKQDKKNKKNKKKSVWSYSRFRLSWKSYLK
jgi:hypothetical protein